MIAFSGILTYHSIDHSGSVLSTSPRVFTEQMRILSELEVDVVSLREIHSRKRAAHAGKPMVAITFDDGFRNVYEQAVPVLQSHQFPATVFLVTEYCSKTNSWPSQPPGIPHQALLDWNQIKEMSRVGIEFGSHTRSHQDLTIISTHEAEDEIVRSKRDIEDAIGYPVDTFAYPYGSYDDTVYALVSKHFTLACSTSLGFVYPDSDSLALERLDMYYFRRLSLVRYLFSPLVGGYVQLRHILRGLRAHIPALPLQG